MSIKKALETFKEYDQLMNEALKELIDAVKKQGAALVQREISEENFEEANKIIQELDAFTKTELDSNIEEIIISAQNIFGGKEISHANEMSNLLTSQRAFESSTPNLIASQVTQKSTIQSRNFEPSVGIIKENVTMTVTEPTPEMEQEVAYSSVAVLTEEEVEMEENMTEETYYEESYTEEERDFITLLGQSAYSRQKEIHKPIDEIFLVKLHRKNMIHLEEVTVGNETYNVFELSEKGRELYLNWNGINPTESAKQSLLKKFGSTEKGFFLYDIERLLQERDYNVHDVAGSQVEISNSKDGRHCYLTPDIGEFSENDYFKILNRKNQLKNIGFICSTEAIMELAMETTRNWASQNSNKCKLLNVHFTNLERLENAEESFQVINFK